MSESLPWRLARRACHCATCATDDCRLEHACHAAETAAAIRAALDEAAKAVRAAENDHACHHGVSCEYDGAVAAIEKLKGL